MQKISSQDAASLLKQAGAAIRHLAKERDDLQTKVAGFQRSYRVDKIARDMQDKGLSSDLSHEQKVAAISKAPNLEVTEEAIKLAAPQGHVLGSLGDDVLGQGVSNFEHFIMTGEDPTDG